MTNHKKPFELLVAAESISNNSSVQHRDNQGELYLFEFIIKNRGFLEIESQRYNCETDSYFMIPPNVDNSYWSAPSVIQEKIFFVCRGTLVKSLVETYGLEQSYIVKNARSLSKFFYNMLILAKQYGAGKDREAALIFHKFVQAAHLIIHQDNKPLLPAMVQRLHKILDTHLEKRIDFTLISQKIPYSQAYTVRLFKQHMGVTPHEYILRRRLETAQLLLKHSTLSIKEIAERLVFSDQYHFSNYFKKRLGISPSQFRKP